jgi:hypothetical protein
MIAAGIAASDSLIKSATRRENGIRTSTIKTGFPSIAISPLAGGDY